MAQSSRPRPTMSGLDLIMRLMVIFTLSWFLYISFINRPSPPTPEMKKALQALKAGNVALARAQFERFLHTQTDNPAAYTQICSLCQVSHHADLMTEYARRGLEACAKADGADRAQLYAQLAIALSESNKTQPMQAQAAAREAQTLDPDNPDILNAAGYVLADTGTKMADLDDAEKMITHALTLLSGRVGGDDQTGFLATVEDCYGWVLYKKGRLYKTGTYGSSAPTQEHFARAVTALAQAASDLPVDASAEAAKTIYYHLGAAYRQAGQPDAARDALATSLRYDPQYADALAEQRALTPASPPTHTTPSTPTAAHAFTPLHTPPSSTQINL